MVGRGIHIGHVSELFFVVKGEHLNMGMVGNIKTLYDNPDTPFLGKHLFYPFTDFVDRRHQSLVIGAFHIPYKADLFFRHYEHLSRLYRVDIQEGKGGIVLVHLMARYLSLDNLREHRVLHTYIVTPAKAVTIVLMAKAKKKQKFVQPRRSVAVAGVIALVVGIGFLVHYSLQQRAVNADRARFAAAQADVQTVAGQITAAVGKPSDRKDGGKCSYAHQKFSKGPLSCEVYSYLAYGVSSPSAVNKIVKKAEKIAGLNSSPWTFKAVTEKPHQFVGGVNYSNNFVELRDLFDTEIKSNLYTNKSNSMDCAISFIYHNSLSNLSSYPSFSINTSQALLLDIDCSSGSKAQIYPVVD